MLIANISGCLDKEEVHDGSFIMAGGARFDIVEIPSGRFLMSGDANNSEVEISRSFLMTRYEVTQEQWEAVMGENPSYFKGSDLPVESVSWFDCMEFIDKLNTFQTDQIFRLPTEAEWEYACRAGSDTVYHYGDNPLELGYHAWYSKNSDKTTHPVGRKDPNGWGLYDMYGNVFEWCSDWYAPLGDEASTDPKGPADGEEKVLRGGSWGNHPQHCTSSHRIKSDPGTIQFNFGLRLVVE
ncbi:MAG: formylglycine-generating enzyme family protein [Candidatus Thermoplasmatota archaeon]|nr:formylglycine-generating enzyme family protein [Candidatus Thermoplasmatota archaeon]